MFMHLVVALLGSFLVVLPPPPIIIDGEETTIDIESIAETVLDADPDDLVDALGDEFPDAALPPGFVNPPPGEDSVLDELLGGPLFDFSRDPAPGQVGEASFSFDTEDDDVPGLFNGGGISYLVLDHEITRGEMRIISVGFETALEEEEATSEDTALEVAMEDLGGVESVSVSLASEDAGVTTVLHLYMVPVGNVLVVTWVMVADFRDFDTGEVQHHANDLAVAAALHLETVAGEMA